MLMETTTPDSLLKIPGKLSDLVSRAKALSVDLSCGFGLIFFHSNSMPNWVKSVRGQVRRKSRW
jgi:hypothetical protein